MQIRIDDPSRADVRALLSEHLADMHATSPAESVHALDQTALSEPHVTFWTARVASALLGCGALKELTTSAAEIKSMRTAQASRGQGVASGILNRLIDEARQRGYRHLYLETGTQDFFDPARRLYRRHGFIECPPFADYRPDPFSVFMTLSLSARPEDRAS